MQRHTVVMFSFGTASYCAAKLEVARVGAENVTLLFADTRYEDEDTYRWGRAAAKDVGARLVEISDGRDVWQVFRDERMVGNSQKDPCSRILKRQLCRRWMTEHYPDPEVCDVAIGIHVEEVNRLPGIVAAWDPWRVRAPLCEEPYLSLRDMRAMVERAGLWEQRLYREGFPHANCGGRCVKGGHAQWRLLLLRRRESYLECEEEEKKMRLFLGKDVTILKDRRGGKTRPMTLREFRERLEKDSADCDLFDFGACDCFSPQAVAHPDPEDYSSDRPES
jgi:hypothetical protein